jgi:hypothetical protein
MPLRKKLFVAQLKKFKKRFYRSRFDRSSFKRSVKKSEFFFRYASEFNIALVLSERKKTFSWKAIKQENGEEEDTFVSCPVSSKTKFPWNIEVDYGEPEERDHTKFPWSLVHAETA